MKAHINNHVRITSISSRARERHFLIGLRRAIIPTGACGLSVQRSLNLSRGGHSSTGFLNGHRVQPHILLVSDLEAQRHLFIDTLGLSVLAEHPGYLRIGGGDGFHIGIEEGSPGPPNAMEITIRVDDVDQMYERLVEAGVEVEGPPEDQDWGARHAWFRDGDRRRMSIYS